MEGHAAMKLNTDRRIEVIRLAEQAPGLYSEAKDPDDPTMKAPAIEYSREFAPALDVKAGDLLLIKVLE
jgi:hypothetical protein